MAQKDEKGNWITHKGESIPPKYVPDLDKKRDALVESCFKSVTKIESSMLKAKKNIIQKVFSYQEWKKNKVKIKEDAKGNLSLVNFSRDKMIELRINDVIEFSDSIELAKSKFDECINKWSEDSDPKIKILVVGAFKADKKGSLSVKKILELKQYKFTDPLWMEAMKLIDESLTINSHRQYLLFKEKDKMGKWQNINLNFSNIGVE